MNGSTLEELDATIQVAVLGAYVDGRLAEEEREVLRECIAVHAENEEQAQVMISFANRLPPVVKVLSPEGRAARLQEIRQALGDSRSRERAFHLAVEVANAHQGIGVREMRYLMALVTDLALDSEYVRKVIYDAIRRHAAQQTDPSGVEKTLRSAMDTLSDAIRDPISERPRVVIEASDGWDAEPIAETTLLAGTEPHVGPTSARQSEPDTIRDEPPTEKDVIPQDSESPKHTGDDAPL